MIGRLLYCIRLGFNLLGFVVPQCLGGVQPNPKLQYFMSVNEQNMALNLISDQKSFLNYNLE